MSYEYCSRSASRLYRPSRDGDSDSDRCSGPGLKDIMGEGERGTDDVDGTVHVFITR
jgi:hypothetical protein